MSHKLGARKRRLLELEQRAKLCFAQHEGSKVLNITPKTIGHIARLAENKPHHEQFTWIEDEVNHYVNLDFDAVLAAAEQHLAQVKELSAGTEAAPEPEVITALLMFDAEAGLPEVFKLLPEADSADNVPGRDIYETADHRIRIYVQDHPERDLRIVAFQTDEPSGMTEEFGGLLLNKYGHRDTDKSRMVPIDAKRYKEKGLAHPWYSTVFYLQRDPTAEELAARMNEAATISRPVDGSASSDRSQSEIIEDTIRAVQETP